MTHAEMRSFWREAFLTALPVLVTTSMQRDGKEVKTMPERAATVADEALTQFKQRFDRL